MLYTLFTIAVCGYVGKGVFYVIDHLVEANIKEELEMREKYAECIRTAYNAYTTTKNRTETEKRGE